MTIDSIKKTFKSTEFVSDKKTSKPKSGEIGKDGLIEDRESDSDFDPEKLKNDSDKKGQQMWDDEENCLGSAAEDFEPA